MKLELDRILAKKEFMAMALDHFRELNPLFVPASDWEKHYFENIQSNPDYSLCWIVADGERAGFVLFGVERHRFLPRRTGAIYELYILPERRREGIAEGCARMVIQSLWDKSPSKIQLEVVEGNVAASRLWKKMGFTKVSERLTLSHRA
jgi:ribosomal protein S18 acetylase RimI-like enzyme